MWISPLISLLLACSHPTADALLQSGKVADAARAWREETGRTLDFGQPAADGLARRAALDRSLGCADIERLIAPVLLLDNTPLRGRRTLDLSFPTLGPVLAAVFELGGQLVAVGRSENPREPEVAHGGDLPWEDGRLVGSATTSAAALALGATIDAQAPPRLVTVGMTDGTTEVFFTIQRSEGLWLTINSLTPPAAAQWINFADYAAQQGPDAARARFGSRLKIAP